MCGYKYWNPLVYIREYNYKLSSQDFSNKIPKNKVLSYQYCAINLPINIKYHQILCYTLQCQKVPCINVQDHNITYTTINFHNEKVPLEGLGALQAPRALWAQLRGPLAPSSTLQQALYRERFNPRFQIYWTSYSIKNEQQKRNS